MSTTSTIKIPALPYDVAHSYFSKVANIVSRKDMFDPNTLSSFFRWFDEAIQSKSSTTQDQDLLLPAKQVVTALSINRCTAIRDGVISRNRWLLNPDTPPDKFEREMLMWEDDEKLTSFFDQLFNIGYTPDEIINFADALIRLIAASVSNPEINRALNHLKQELIREVLVEY